MTSLMPETIEPATGGSAGGPGGTLPLPKAKTPRKSWTQAEVVALCQKHTKGGEWPTGHTDAEDDAKLIELGLVAKPEKAALTDHDKSGIDTYLLNAVAGTKDEPRRSLAIRYAIKSLQSLLPKRAAK